MPLGYHPVWRLELKQRLFLTESSDTSSSTAQKTLSSHKPVSKVATHPEKP